MSPAPFVPPPYPYERLDALHRQASAVEGGVVDCSVGTPCDPVPEVVVRAAGAATDAAMGYPPSAGTPAFRGAAAGWMRRRLGVDVDPAHVGACIGTKELVASLPHVLRLRDPARDTVLYPAVSYPTYAMGAQLAGLRAVPVPLDGDWHLDLAAVDDDDARRALLLWVNEPGNPTSAVAPAEHLRAASSWARERGIVLAADECYVEFGPGASSVLAAGTDHTLAVHSLSKRSNMAGMRAGFYAGDPELVQYLVEVRKHAGCMVPAPVQAAATAALADDAHVAEQRDRYARRRALVEARLAERGLVHDGGPGLFYLWLRSLDPRDDGWSITQRFAASGLLVSPGEFYGPGGAAHVRLALVQPLDRLELALDRLDARARDDQLDHSTTTGS